MVTSHDGRRSILTIIFVYLHVVGWHAANTNIGVVVRNLIELAQRSIKYSMKKIIDQEKRVIRLAKNMLVSVIR